MSKNFAIDTQFPPITAATEIIIPDSIGIEPGMSFATQNQIIKPTIKAQRTDKIINSPHPFAE